MKTETSVNKMAHIIANSRKGFSVFTPGLKAIGTATTLEGAKKLAYEKICKMNRVQVVIHSANGNVLEIISCSPIKAIHGHGLL